MGIKPEKGTVIYMDDGQLREVFLERLHIEIQLFKDSMLQRTKADIYAASYRIELYVNLYEILVVLAERMPEVLIRALLYQNSGILEAFYGEWMKQDDAFYTELREYAEDELEAVLTGVTADGGKEGKDGKRDDKAA